MLRSLVPAIGALLLASGCAGSDNGAAEASGRASSTVERGGVRLTLPSHWRSAVPDDGVVSDPVTLLAVASGPIEHRRGPCQIASYEFGADAVALVLVEWHGAEARAHARPSPITARDLPLEAAPAVECFPGAGGSIFFADQTRVFGAYVLLGPDAPPALAAEARRLLGTLEVTAPEQRSVSLVALAARSVAHCRRSSLLRSVCPQRVPRVRAPYLSHLATGLTGDVDPLHVFNLERGGEDPAEPRNNRPPRMGHLVAFGGRTDAIASFDVPWRDAAAPLSDGLLRRERTQPISFGRVSWAGHEGLLYLAPPYLHGGMLGNHLVFTSWSGRTPYGISLHAWEPLRESAATLRAVVESRSG